MNNLLLLETSPGFDDYYCIDLQNNERVVFISGDDQDMDVVNSSLERFLKCKYILKYYYHEIESKKFGPYQKNRNKYVQLLRKMLNDAEPGIENYPTWQEMLSEKEMGVM